MTRWLALLLMLPSPAYGAVLTCTFPEARYGFHQIAAQTFNVDTISLYTDHDGSSFKWFMEPTPTEPGALLRLTIVRERRYAAIDLYVEDDGKLRSVGSCIERPWLDDNQRLFRPDYRPPWLG